MRTRHLAVAAAALAASGCITIVVNEPPAPVAVFDVDDEAPPAEKTPVAARSAECLDTAIGEDCDHARALLAQRPAAARTWATLVRAGSDGRPAYDPVSWPLNSKPLFVDTFVIELPEPRRLRAVELYPAHHARIAWSIQILDAFGDEATHDDRLLDTSDPNAPVRVIDIGCDKPPIASVRITMRYELPSGSGEPFGAVAGLVCD
jgi:hypothetical protein